ncbi:MAG: hypothetical protein WC384_03450 [Prolixibacteraceae bacterium]|jgi:hypothetical protein
MKKKITLVFFTLLAICTLNVKAQEESSWSTGVDLYNTYVWRGTKFGSGPSLQPTVKYSNSGFTIGAWGAYSFSNSAFTVSEGTEVDAYMEADLWASYGFELGEKSSLTFTVTDYFFPSSTSEYFDGSQHYVEPMVSLGLGSFSLTGAYMTNVNDMYLEAGLAVGAVSLFAGAGDGQYTKDASFNVCNLGIKTSKEIKISDSFSIPITGAVIMNPSTEKFHIVVGITL